MKVAASLSLALAIILAIWAVSDYANNERNSQRDLAAAWRHLSDDRYMSDLNRDSDLETQDGLIGAGAFVALIASVVMFSKAKKNNAPMAVANVPLGPQRVFCSACGKQLANSARFCDSCGRQQPIS